MYDICDSTTITVAGSAQLTSNNSAVMQASIIKQLDALRRQLSTEERKVQAQLEKNMVRYSCSLKSFFFHLQKCSELLANFLNILSIGGDAAN